MKKQIQLLIQDQKGANLVEYIILLALIAIVVIAAVRTFGTAVSGKFTEKEGEVQNL
jgi:Flp pilus assembly pilin Flp